MKISQTRIRPANQIQKTVYSPSFGKIFSIKLPFFKQDTVEISDDNIPAMSEKRLLPIIKSSMNSEHFIGSGSTAKVFRLKDSDYVAKIPYDTYFFVDKDFKKLPMYSSYKANHIEDVFENGITIMKYIKGDPLKRPDDFKKLVKLPAEAFNKLLKQVCDAKNYGLDLDGVPENFILNYDKKTITAIDFIPEYIYPEDNPPFRPLIDILSALCYSDNNSYKLRTTGLILLAGLKELHPNVKPCATLQELNFSEFMEFIEQNYKKVPTSIPVQWSKLKDMLLELQCLKIKESQDKSIQNLLQCKLSNTENFIKENFGLNKPL